MKCSTSALKSVSHWKEKPMGAELSFLGQKHAKCENISCCTSVAAVHPPAERAASIYVDSRKRVAGLDSDFEVDLGESLHLQSDARLTVYKIRLANSFLSTDRGRYLYWVDAALGTLSVVAQGRLHRPPAGRLDQLQLCTATYSKTTNSLSAYDGNRLILNDLSSNSLMPRTLLRRPPLPPSPLAWTTCWARALSPAGL